MYQNNKSNFIRAIEPNERKRGQRPSLKSTEGNNKIRNRRTCFSQPPNEWSDKVSLDGVTIPQIGAHGSTQRGVKFAFNSQNTSYREINE
ncbi:hypothetical protein CDAR_280991 [Caerostris darwini]|uniref:Uncharacterized protein n=1 Tax=Caerostris darwini TaxID=1538125 RepID=A0AAV4V9R2_9ARAC|nr:hypothetical protein CDAR_280991 [Caerostris darwini]